MANAAEFYVYLKDDGTIELVGKWPNVADWQAKHGRDITVTHSGGEVNDVYAVINGQLCKNGEPV